MIFEATQMQEKCQDENDHIYTTSVDQTKVSDTQSNGYMQDHC